MEPVFAYLDPMTGSTLMQILLGALAAVSVGYQVLRRRAGDLWIRFRRSPSNDEADESAPV